MGLGQVALGIASLVMGVNHLRNGARQLSALDGLAGRPPLSPLLRQPRREYLRETRGLSLGMTPVNVRVPGRAFANTGHKTVATLRGNRVMRMRSYNIRTLDDRIAYLQKLADEGKRDPEVYAFVRRAIGKKCGGKWCIPEKDNLGEAHAVFSALHRARPPRFTQSDIVNARGIFKGLRRNVRYTSDIAGVDTYQRPSHTLALGAGDCIPGGSLLLREDGIMVPIEDICEGDTIFDGTGWAKVTKWWHKGVQDIRALGLNNGSVFLSTDGHRMFRVPRKDNRIGAAVDAEEVLAKDIDIGDELLQPRELAFAEGRTLDPDKAFLLGVYIAEGSVRRRRVDGTLACVGIAGIADSKGYRERLIEAGERLGFAVAVHKKEVYLTDAGTTLHTLLSGCGAKAFVKRLPHVQWTPETALDILSGLDADGGMATNGTNFVFSTTSRTLAVQYRLLQRLQGKSTSIKMVIDHGGFGENPVYRVTVRKDNRRLPWAKVRQISEAAPDHVYDIETDSSRFYLPEQDIVVHNCDDYSSTTCAALGAIGIPCRYKVIRTKGAKDWNHIYAQAGFPRANPQRWISMDSSVNMPFGWEAPPRMVAASRVFRAR